MLKFYPDKEFYGLLVRFVVLKSTDGFRQIDVIGFDINHKRKWIEFRDRKSLSIAYQSASAKARAQCKRYTHKACTSRGDTYPFEEFPKRGNKIKPLCFPCHRKIFNEGHQSRKIRSSKLHLFISGNREFAKIK